MNGAAAMPIVGGVPEWAQLLPLGVIPSRDGRPAWRLSNAAAVIAATQARGVDPVIDYEHQTDHAAANGNPAPAAGWVRLLMARADGIWARIEWTARARRMLEAREYRFLSPVFEFDQATREVHRILRAGLTNDPALYLQAIARMQDDGPLDELERAICRQLGIDEASYRATRCQLEEFR